MKTKTITMRQLKTGMLCYAVLTPYQGKGAPKIILHKVDSSCGFSYGHMGHIVLDPPKKKAKRKK